VHQPLVCPRYVPFIFWPRGADPHLSAHALARASHDCIFQPRGRPAFAIERGEGDSLLGR
jgi:hypothetical protein